MSELLEGRNAIVYGGGGGIGGAVAASSRRDGARVFLVGRSRESLEAVAKDIEAAGGAAHVAVHDVLDEAAVDAHVDDVASRAGSVDVSCNLISRGDVQGTPLVEMTVEDLLRAPTTDLRSNFLTARAAARRMIAQRSGVILHLQRLGCRVDAGHGQHRPGRRGGRVVQALPGRRGRPSGLRVCGIWTAGVEETLASDKLAEVNPDTPDPQTAIKMISGVAALRRTPRLANVAETAAFLASDRAAGITGSMTNVTAGLVLR